jgi:eukaryotic-like serine/threonine-protein kinase
MPPDRWQQIDELYHAALEHGREALAGADPELKRQVERLLEQDTARDGLLDHPAAELLGDSTVVTLAAGTRLGPYEIIAPIGKGGMGEVFRARDTRLGRDVAIKVAHERFSDRFEHEARAIAALNHPNICTLYDVGPDYLVMELIEDPTLADRIEQAPIPLEEALDIAKQVADALEAAHEKGIVHRDLKPVNIIRMRDGRVKVLDFGIAAFQQPMEDGATRSHTLTLPGTTIGTVAYMSPEQARGQPVDARSDLWSLGVVLYEMAAGARPFQGPTTAVVFDAVLNKPPVPMRERNPRIPVELEKLVAKLLEKDLTQRSQSAAELRADLKLLDNGSITTPAPARLRPVAVYSIAAVALIATAAGGLILRQRAQPSPLTDKDVLVLGDFVNNTGDPVFNTTLREALSVQLEQSPFLKIMDDAQMREDLKLMGRSPDEHITNQLAREICQREGDKAMIAGMIAGFGSSYPITLEAANCQTGETLAREQVQAAGKDRVLQAVSTAVSGMRRRLGESLASIRQLDRPLEQVTTTSLEAFQNFSLGEEQFDRGDYAAAIPFFQRATELDPNFASAWGGLGGSFLNAHRDRRLADEFLTRTFELRDRVSEKERAHITAGYFTYTNHDFAKATDALELLLRNYPRDPAVHSALGVVHHDLGQLEEALKDREESYRLEPRSPANVDNLMEAFADLSRFDDAKALAGKTFARHLDPPRMHEMLLAIAVAQDDPAAEAKEIRWFAGKPDEAFSVGQQAVNAGTHGQLRRARELSKQIGELARQRNQMGLLADFEPVRTLLALGASCPAVQSLGAAAVVLCTDVEGPLKAAEEEAKKYPADATVNEIKLPTLRARVELRRDNAAKAIELLQSVAPYERTAPPCAAFYRGLAYLQLHKPEEAGIEFQKLLDNPGLYFGGPEYPLSFLGRARAAALSGDTAKATKVYEDFFAYWKDADSDLPVLIQARKEYAALPGHGR